MAALRPTVTTLGAFTLSVAMIAPTLGMAFNVSLAAGAAGRATPLAFLLGGLVVAVLGLSFVAFSRRIASAGSSSAYVASAFGPRLGFLTGWALLLAYFAFLTAATALIGGFLATGLAHLGIERAGLWLVLAVMGGAIAIWLGGREIRLVAHVMLAIEILAVAGILLLAILILAETPLSLEPLRPDPSRGWSGVGYGIVFAVLSLAGFEGAAALGEETRDPYRAIPVAILGSVIVATLFFAFVSYAQVLGYGLARVDELAQSSAPLDALSARYLSPGYAIFLDLSAGISSLACALGTASAGGRILYALSRDGLASRLRLDMLDPVHGAPQRAVWLFGGLNLVALALFGFAGFRAYSEAFATLATLTLILVYGAVAAALATDAWRGGQAVRVGIGAAGVGLLVWPLLNSVVPTPPWPANLWPLVIAAWLGLGLALARRRWPATSG